MLAYRVTCCGRSRDDYPERDDAHWLTYSREADQLDSKPLSVESIKPKVRTY